jgi:hypothetical protein
MIEISFHFKKLKPTRLPRRIAGRGESGFVLLPLLGSNQGPHD